MENLGDMDVKQIIIKKEPNWDYEDDDNAKQEFDLQFEIVSRNIKFEHEKYNDITIEEDIKLQRTEDINSENGDVISDRKSAIINLNENSSQSPPRARDDTLNYTNLPKSRRFQVTSENSKALPRLNMEEKRKILTSEVRKIVWTVSQYFEEEKKKQGFIIDPQKVVKRVSAATGKSERTVKRIRAEGRRNEETAESFQSPNKKHKRSNRFEFDDMDDAILRRIIHNFYVKKKEVPTVMKITEELRTAIDFDGKEEFVRRRLHKIGFRFLKCQSNRKLLVEKPEIVAARQRYLRAIRQARAQTKNIVYLDESYVHTTSTVSKCWQAEEDDGVLQSCGKGARFILAHAGGENGFVNNADLIFKSGKKTGDYHDDMNAVNFTKWVNEKLIPNLPPNTVIVMDNAPYHNKEISKPPNTGSKKVEIQEWLRNESIHFDDGMVKCELLELVKKYSPAKRFIIDALLMEHGHQAVRLPSYHPDLNPIEMVWKLVKDVVKSKNMCSLSEAATIKAIEEGFQSITREKWMSLCKRVEEVENKYWQDDGMLENEVERLFISLGPCDSDSESDDDESDLSG